MKKFFKAFFRVIFAPFRWLKKLFDRTPLGQLLGPDPEDTPIAETINKAVDSPKTFWEGIIVHLADLRKAIIKSFVVLVITSLLAFTYMEDILAWMAVPLGEEGLNSLSAIDVTETISVAMRVAFFVGGAVSLPYIAFQILAFVGPGISRRSRLIGLFGLPFVLLFFTAGVYFAYAVMFEPALNFLSSYMQIQNAWRVSSYFKFVTSLMFWIGVSFELPLVAFVLSAMGILKPETLLQQWRLALILLTILAAAITPTTDVFNMGIVLVPLLALYGLSIVLSFIARGRREKRLETS
jgi:sec-independent protein translocase protein TatC